MNAELPENAEGTGTVGWVLYDAACPFCCRWAGHSARLLARRGFKVLPLQTEWVRRRLEVAAVPLLREMRLLTAEGELFGAAEALLHLARYFWWARPLAWIGNRVFILDGLERHYRFVANRYHCSLNCSVSQNRLRRRRSGRLVSALSLLTLWWCIRLLRRSRKATRKSGRIRKSHRVSSFYRMP